MQILIQDERRKRRISRDRLKKVSAEILKILRLPQESSVSIALLERPAISRLNKKYFGKNRATDVIALGYDKSSRGRQSGFKRRGQDLYPDYLGDIIICPAVALANSKIYKNTYLEELTLYIIHGILHLIGYDHIKRADRVKMQKKQQEVLKRLCC